MQSINSSACVAMTAVVPLLYSQSGGMERTQSRMLQAYNNNDATALEQLLSEWAKESSIILHARKRCTIETSAIASDIYMAIYKANAINADQAGKESYHTIQNSVTVKIVENLDRNDKIGDGGFKSIKDWNLVRDHIVIHDFGPAELCDMPNVILLDYEREQEILQFLSADSDALLVQRWLLSSKSEESDRRLRFLRQKILVFGGHWGMGWTWESVPIVRLIVLNKQATEAHVWLERGHGGSVVAVKKRGDKWILADPPISYWLE